MRIFISYAHQNRDIAGIIAADLRARGAEVFIDYRSLAAGDEFPERLRDEILACDVFLLLMSAQSAASRWVRQEEALAQHLHKRIIPVKLDDLDVARSPFWRCVDRDWVLWADGADAACARIAAALRLDEPDSVGTGFAPSSTPQPVPSRTPQGASLQATWERPPFEPETVRVPAGPFLMGSTPQQLAQLDLPGWYKPEREQPQHTVILPDYHIGKYPVTVGEFRAFVEAGGYLEPRFWTEAGWQQREQDGWTAPDYWHEEQWTGDDRLPVIGVSWYEVVAYARWLSDVTGREYRLPTEAEWEKAARGPDGRIYPWGNNWREGVCNSAEAGIGQTSPVGQFSPQGDSPYSAADMVGNMWEWCVTRWRDNYDTAEDNDPDTNARRVLRGGSWGFARNFARVAARGYGPYSPFSRYDDVGFRVVRAPHL